MIIAQGGVWPDVDLEGHYYTKRVGASQDVDWDVLFTVEVPLFQGGRAAGAISEARSRARQARLRFEEAQRAAGLEIRDVSTRFNAAIARHAALQKAAAAAEQNYRLQVEDYGRNLVNNLNVLQALQDLQDVRRDVISAAYEIQRLHWRLRVATGETF